MGEENTLASVGVNNAIGLVVSMSKKIYIIGASGGISSPSLISVVGIIPHS